MISYISKLPPQGYANASPRSIAILGSTGSIGRNALQVIAEQPESFTVIALSAGRNIELLAKQAEKLRPPFLAVLDEHGRASLKKLLPANYHPEILTGQKGYEELARLPEASLVLSAQVGAAGLAATAAAASAGKVIALANKESLVLAGQLLRDLCHKHNSCILPVDSEHNAIFQCLLSAIYPAQLSRNGKKDQNNAEYKTEKACSRLILTASGGPFRGKGKNFLKNVRKEQALRHPKWQMGSKISIDSATLMNKGLEVIEACMLYGLPQDKVEVLVHPQSIVHSMVEFSDSSVLAQLGPADMRVPLANCLGWPERIKSGVPPLDFLQSGPLTFEKPDNDVFPCLNLCRAALDMQQGATIVLNAANEVAVELFLRDKIPFLRIPELIEKALDWHSSQNNSHATPDSIEDILELDINTRKMLQ